MSIDGRCCRTHLGSLWRVADDDATVHDIGLAATEAFAELGVAENLTQALRCVLLLAQTRASVSLHLVKNCDGRDDVGGGYA